MSVPRLVPVLVLLVAGAGARAEAVDLPGPFSASYALESHGTTIARTSVSLVPAGDGRFVYESRTEATGLFALVRDEKIVERSEWRGVAGRLQPLDYRYLRAGGKRDREVHVAFDWGHGVARNTVRGDTWKMSIPVGTLDKLSYLLAMMRDLADGKRDLVYRVADGGHIKRYELRELGRERLETSLGPLDTVKVRRLRHDGRQTVMWCAPALAYLPVRIEHHEHDGTSIALYVREVEGLGRAAPRGAAAGG